MAITYPTTLDVFTNPLASDLLTSPDHATQHANINDAVEALEAKVAIGNTVLGTYTSYTPTYPSGLTVGNATVTSQYARVNNFVHYWGRVVWGSTTSQSASQLQVSLPIAGDTNFIGGNVAYCGQAGFRQGASQVVGVCSVNSGFPLIMNVLAQLSSGTYVSQTIVTTTVPFTWASTDTIWWNVMYKAA